MSKRRDSKQVQEEVIRKDPAFLRKVIIAVIVLFALGAVYYFGYQRRMHKYDAFARCLTQKGVKMYGAWWCPHCSDQKKLFDASFQYAPYVECGFPDNTSKMQTVCVDAGIKHFPTWQFPPVGERVEGEMPLEDLSLRTGCPLQ
jgi:hypothetical protein